MNNHHARTDTSDYREWISDSALAEAESRSGDELQAASEILDSAQSDIGEAERVEALNNRAEAERAEAEAVAEIAEDDERHRLWIVFSYENDAEADYCDWLIDVDAEAAVEQALSLRSYCSFARAYLPSELATIAERAATAAAEIGETS